jgi:peptidoglycan/xylan/chitin deacetylase (PgdA/CDA1 family)
VKRPLILMYHRIADEPVDYWGLAVSPRHFEEQLSVLRRTRHPLALREFVLRLVDGTLPADAVALTFDDGYVDNLTAGLPRLTAADVPATVFLATGFLDRLEPFWWDELARLILLESCAKRFEVVMHGQPMCFELGVEPPANEDGVKSEPWPKRRRDVLEAIYHPIRRLDEKERQATMAQLRSIFAKRNDRARLGRAMTGDEVRALVADSLVTVGAHTVTHPLLPELDAAQRHRELIESKIACEALVGAPVPQFAYPYGESDAATLEAVKDAGFAFACSTGRAAAVSASDLFALRRIYITNLGGDAFEQRIATA